jgi:hypothetical protein
MRTSASAPPYLVPGTYWGGVFTASTGESVTVYVSDGYPQDSTTGQHWADFLASLVHGSELASLIVYLAPPAEVATICGKDAVACYGVQNNLLIAPGEDPTADTSAEAVVTHEYGHHVAAHRSNAPWAAIDFGTKRWSSFMQVCADASGGKLYPGAEQLPRYQLNPGEGFAEAYRVLNERSAGLPEPPWDIVSQSLYPDDTALSLLRADVTTPWVGARATVRTSTVTQAIPARTYTLATPLDGTLRVTLRTPPRARVRLQLVSASGTVLATKSGGGQLSVATTVCGDRSVVARVSRLTGAGTFRLTVAQP